MGQTLLLSEQDVRALLPMEDVVAAVEKTFRGMGDGTVVNPSKVNLDLGEIAPYPPYNGFMNAMPAYVGFSDVAGLKWAGGNLGERKKELATIKVLGFYDKEVYRYIFREIDLLALMGSCVGLLLGIPLHQFIIRTVEMDQLMFIRTIAPHSYLLAVALTMVFTVVVCFVMRRHVRRISMVESMKAPE